MPSLLHEAILELFRLRPMLAAELLQAVRIIDASAFSSGALVESQLNEVTPVEYRADSVIRLDGARPLAVITEAQLRPDDDKWWIWPAYFTSARARLRIDTVLLIVTPDPEAWADREIVLGPGASMRPVVLGPGRIPRVTDPEEARGSPELAVLSALAHGQGPQGESIGRAAIGAASTLDPERIRLYTDLVLRAVHHAARKVLENLMLSNWEPQSDFWKRIDAERHLACLEAKNEGREEGREEGKRKLLRLQMERRFGPLSAAALDRIGAADDAQLDQWALELLYADSPEALLGRPL